MSLRSLAALLLAAFALLAPAAAQRASADAPGERITSFRADIDIAADAGIHVAETIQLVAEGQSIRHGIYRDIPSPSARDGRGMPAGFAVDGVERDGRTEIWRSEAIGGGVRIWIGDADRDVARGAHTYVIRYTVTGQLGFLPNYDELYWNVIGTSWMFPIDRAEARIRLPRPVPFGRRAFYTGAQGSTAGDAEVTSESPGEIVLRTTRPLEPHEGLTVAVSWPKGVVAPPTVTKRNRGSAS